MYYSHPESAEAYRCPQQYWFGSELVAAPFTRPAEVDTGLARQIVWLPPDDWFNFFTGEHVPPGWRTIYGDLDDIPVFARAGAIVPLGEPETWGSTANPCTLHLDIFPGKDGRFDLYEDDGETLGYTQGKSSLTSFGLQWQPQALAFTIYPVSGDLSVVPERRTYQLHFRGIVLPERVSVRVNGVAAEAITAYDPETATLSLAPIVLHPAEDLNIDLSVQSGDLLSRRDRSLDSLRKLLFHFRLDSWIKAEIERQWPRIAAGELDLHAFRTLTASQASALHSLIAADLL
jgi:hypothetical protein